MATIALHIGNTTDAASGYYDVHLPLPYPYFVDAKTGDVGRQDVWQGKPLRILGFQRNLDVHEVDVLWKDAVTNPKQVVGMFPVVLDADGTMGNLRTPVMKADETA